MCYEHTSAEPKYTQPQNDCYEGQKEHKQQMLKYEFIKGSLKDT